MLGAGFRAETTPSSYYLALCVSSVAPIADHNVFGSLNAIASGDAYDGIGAQVLRNATDFDVWIEDDTNDRALIQIKDIVWTASGGNIPRSGGGARYAVLVDNVTGSLGLREVYIYWDLVSDRTVSNGQALTLQDCEIRLNET